MGDHADPPVTEDACRVRHAGTSRMLYGTYLLLTTFLVIAGWSASVAWSESARVGALEKSDAVQAKTFEMINYRLDEIQKGIERLQSARTP